MVSSKLLPVKLKVI